MTRPHPALRRPSCARSMTSVIDPVTALGGPVDGVLLIGPHAPAGAGNQREGGERVPAGAAEAVPVLRRREDLAVPGVLRIRAGAQESHPSLPTRGGGGCSREDMGLVADKGPWPGRDRPARWLARCYSCAQGRRPPRRRPRPRSRPTPAVRERWREGWANDTSYSSRLHTRTGASRVRLPRLNAADPHGRRRCATAGDWDCTRAG
jgi:hypothetical protein